MPIPNYVRPQLTIEQILQRTPDATRDRLTAVVIGRQHLINRFNKVARAYGVTHSATGYSSTGATAGIPFKVYNSVSGTFSALDTSVYTIAEDDVDVWVANGEAIHLDLNSADMDNGVLRIKSAADANTLVLSSSVGKFTSEYTEELYSELDGRAVTVGDIFYVTETTGATPRKRTVTAVSAQQVVLSGPVVSDTFATPVSATLGVTAAGASAVTLSSTAGLTGGMPVVSVGGTAGYFAADTYITAVSATGVSLNAGITGGNGASVAFAKVLAAVQSTIIVNENLPTTQFTVDTENTQVILEANAEVEIAEFTDGSESRVLKDGKGTIYPSYRALRQVPATEGLVLIESPSDITTELGLVDLENELSFAANECLSGSQGKSIYVLRVEDDSVTAVSAALRKIEATDSVYALCPITDVLEVKQAVATHCEAMSQKDVKNFRRCYVGTDSPGEYLKLGTYDDEAIQASITVSQAGIVLDILTAGVNLETLNLVDGDIVKMCDSNGVLTGAEYTILAVTDSDSAYLNEGPVTSIGVDVDDERFIQIWKANTPESQAEYVSDVSAALGSRRAINVWVDNGTRLIGDATTVVPNKYLAAEIAGLRTAVIPWQGLTLTEVNTVTEAPAMYTRYNKTLLNEVAASGTLVVTQEAETGAMFIRHQLTTKTDGGSLAYEDSIGVSLDFISFLVKDALGSFIGRKNVTRQTLEEIYNTVWNILNDATTTSVVAAYGPQLNGFSNKAGERNKIDVAAHPTLKDRVTVYARLLMPLPLNVLEVVLDASVDFAL